ncbi:hypothetical protein [Streptomyces sp. NPDC001978]|uniref:hypothetical protein n=1 Tax=Streptomyces sp. NPDC001978 TaxID=3364627 RepID=UPI0036A80926
MTSTERRAPDAATGRVLGPAVGAVVPGELLNPLRTPTVAVLVLDLMALGAELGDRGVDVARRPQRTTAFKVIMGSSAVCSRDLSPNVRLISTRSASVSGFSPPTSSRTSNEPVLAVTLTNDLSGSPTTTTASPDRRVASMVR